MANTNELESAILRNFEPGAYTAIVRGVASGTGVGLVEVFISGVNGTTGVALAEVYALP